MPGGGGANVGRGCCGGGVWPHCGNMGPETITTYLLLLLLSYPDYYYYY